MPTYKTAARDRLEQLTGDDLKTVIYQLSKIPYILLIYEHKFDVSAHSNEMFLLLRVTEFLQEVEKE